MPPSSLDAQLRAGALQVPENRRVPGSRSIRLSVRVLPGPADGPVLFHLTGGPGMSNLGQRYPAGLRSAFRIVEVGYRGLDSRPALDGRPLARVLGERNLSSPVVKQRMADAFGACVAQWQEQGFDLAGYQMRDIVDDLEEVRGALGLGRVHLLAESYGTRVAMHYMTWHPEAIASSVLMGANPPGHFFWSAADVHGCFDAYQPYFEAACPEYRGKLTLEQLLVKVLDDLPAGWLGLRIDRDRARIATFMLLFHRATSAWAFDAYLRALERRRFGRFAVASLLVGVGLPRMSAWGDFFLKGLFADYDPTRDYAQEVAAAPGRFGSPLGELLFTPPYERSLLAVRDPPAPLRLVTPTLVLSGGLDFSTPARHARDELVAAFPEVVHQCLVPELGHVTDFWREPALVEVLVQFFGGGKVPSPDAFPKRAVAFRR